ncbi:MAG: hypothetical protein Q9201_006293 [Fulgogasparrea decipioides]
MLNLSVQQKQTLTTNVKPPTPLPSLAEYMTQQLKQRADYAWLRITSKNRKPTPNSLKLLILYYEACTDYLLNEDQYSDPEKSRRIDEIRLFDIDINNREFLKDFPPSSLPQELINLRLAVYWTRYADYAGYLATIVRKEPQQLPKTPFAEHISGQSLWTKISAQLRNEEPEYQKYVFKYQALVKTTYAVYKAAERAGIDFDAVIGLIHLYADRNQAFHRGIKEDLASSSWNDIARKLFEDLRDLASVCPPDMAVEEDQMRAVLLELQSDWFDISSNPNNPSSWVPRVARLQQAAGIGQQSNQSAQAHAQQVAQNAVRRLALDQEKGMILAQALATPEKGKLPETGPGPSKKRKASRTLEPEQRRKAWNLIMEQQNGINTQILSIIKKRREVNRMVSVHRDAFGDEGPPEEEPSPKKPQDDEPSISELFTTE